MNMKVHYMSKTEEWETPQELYNVLDKLYYFTLDPCATKENKKCRYYFDKNMDGLCQSWEGHRVFMNPPYGRKISKWIKKAYNESLSGNTKVICLIPSRTDTRWWHDYVMKGEVTFIKGRLKFGKYANSAPFPSAIVVFGYGQNNKERYHSFSR
jgi:phage N-6-adenine-methyltransferase